MLEPERLKVVWPPEADRQRSEAIALTADEPEPAGGQSQRLAA
jgi:hypothetical protein